MRAALPSPPLVPRPLTIIRAPCPAPRSVCSTTFDCFLTAQIDLASPSPPPVAVHFEFRSPVVMQDIAGMLAAR